MDQISELRVHGVSGTPPRVMLYTDPVTDTPREHQAKVYRSPGQAEGFDPTVEVFHWGSLTSGKWITALWILLAPFSFANAAGWMGRIESAWSRSLIRLAGLGLTALFVSQLVMLALDIAYFAVADAGSAVAWVRVLSTITAALFVAIVWFLSTQSHFEKLGPRQRFLLLFGLRAKHLVPTEFWNSTIPDEQWVDPGDRTIRSPSLWARHSVLHRLRRAHMTVGFGVVALTVATGMDHQAGRAAAAAVVLLVLLLVMLEPIRANRVLYQIAPLIGLVLLVTVLVTIGGSQPPTGLMWPGVHKLTFEATALIGLFVVLVPIGELPLALFRWLRNPSERSRAEQREIVFASLLPPGAFAIAALIGASFGIAAALILGRFATNTNVEDNGADWVTVMMLLLVLWIVALAVIFLFRRPAGEDATGPWWARMLVRITARARWLFVGAGLFGLAAGVLAAAQACSGPFDCDPAHLEAPLNDWSIPILPTWDFEGFTLDLSNPVDLSRLLVVLAPAFFMVKPIFARALDPDKRRKVGILWDLGSFWPRWYHPLGPPAYGPHAVDRLTSEVSARKPAILGAHSQGSVVAAVVIGQKKLPIKGFITYGSPIGHIYAKLFPRVGMMELTNLVLGAERMNGAWINLRRSTDYVGASPIPGIPQQNDRQERSGVGHSGYERTEGFRKAKAELMASTMPS